MKNKKILISLLFFFTILLFSNICMAKDLDKINEYTITVDPRSNGTLDMTYHLEWEVLDSTSEGPLEWIKIGIPNANVSNIKALSKNIKKISYYSDNGDYIRIDFKQSYEEGEVLDIDFKFNQSHMYTLANSSCNYSFTPGWFNDIDIAKLTIKWNSKDVKSCSPETSISDGYYVWSKNNMLKGKKITIDVTYSADTFKTSSLGQSSNSTVTTTDTSNNAVNQIALIFTILIIISVISSILSIFSGGSYYSHRGYGYYPYRRSRPHYSHRTSSRSSCVNSCACACACASGGRAGCSKKDLYGTNLKTKKLNEILNT